LCYIVRFHHKNFDFTAFPEETDNDRPVDVWWKMFQIKINSLLLSK
jgi:hypothetical protein